MAVISKGGKYTALSISPNYDFIVIALEILVPLGTMKRLLSVEN